MFAISQTRPSRPSLTDCRHLCSIPAQTLAIYSSDADNYAKRRDSWQIIEKQKHSHLHRDPDVVASDERLVAMAGTSQSSSYRTSSYIRRLGCLLSVGSRRRRRLLTPAKGHGARSVGALLHQRLVELAPGPRVNRRPAVLAIILKRSTGSPSLSEYRSKQQISLVHTIIIPHIIVANY